jgi:uncharacterized membrane protein YfcA
MHFTISVVLILMLIGLAAGFLSGTVGVGGGLIVVPALVYFLGLTQHQAQGTSLMMLSFPVGIFAAYQYYKSEHMQQNSHYLIIACILISTFFIGSYLGGKTAVKIDKETIKKIFGVLMIVVGIKMFFNK